MMKPLFYIFLVVLILAACNSPVNNTITVIPAHAHNDYEHEHPLFDALEQHFKSVEADVYSVGDSLFVAHNSDQIQPGRTLRQLYLEPLKERVEENKGSVYCNGESIFLLLDIKDDAERTYRLLHGILEKYRQMLTVVENGQQKTGAVTVVVSGNRPFELMQGQNIRYAGYDGRLGDLDSEISPALMPMVSDNWGKYFSWDGNEPINDKKKQRLKRLAEKAKNNGYVLRFWGTPDATREQRAAVWKELNEAGVGLIGADKLQELHDFLLLE